MSEQGLPAKRLQDEIKKTMQAEVADWLWSKEIKNEPPKVGEVWGVPGEPRTWRLVAESISPSQVQFRSFIWGEVIPKQDWHAWIAEVKAERIFPPTQVTTGPWPQQNWTQQT